MKKYLVILSLNISLILSGCTIKDNLKKTNISTVSTIDEASYITSKELTFSAKKILKNKSLIITSLVNIENPQVPSKLERLFLDTLITDFNRQGWHIIDFRGKDIITETKTGEFYLNKKKIIDIAKNSIVFLGTYGQYNKKILLNLRLLNLIDNSIISTSIVQLKDIESNNALNKSNHNLSYIVKKIKVKDGYWVKVLKD